MEVIDFFIINKIVVSISHSYMNIILLDEFYIILIIIIMIIIMIIMIINVCVQVDESVY